MGHEDLTEPGYTFALELLLLLSSKPVTEVSRPRRLLLHRTNQRQGRKRRKRRFRESCAGFNHEVIKASLTNLPSYLVSSGMVIDPGDRAHCSRMSVPGRLYSSTPPNCR